jgi:hypothetical protein
MSQHQQFLFQNKGAAYFRAQTQHLHSFEDVIQFFARQGVRRGQAINLARKTHPDRYNTWMRNARKDTPTTTTVATKTVHAMDMRKPSGVPVITFRGV